MALQDHYRPTYGRHDHAPDFSKCCASVFSGQSVWDGSHQCSFSRGYGPDGAYCKIHDPQKAEARKAESDRKFNQGMRQALLGAYGAEMIVALLAIEAGHNDPRAAATKALERVRKSKYVFPKDGSDG